MNRNSEARLVSEIGLHLKGFSPAFVIHADNSRISYPLNMAMTVMPSGDRLRFRRTTNQEIPKTARLDENEYST